MSTPKEIAEALVTMNESSNTPFFADELQPLAIDYLRLLAVVELEQENAELRSQLTDTSHERLIEELDQEDKRRRKLLVIGAFSWWAFTAFALWLTSGF